jgi:ubiquinone/menaquinone biosynthesis C-methylase UbiE
MTDAVRMKHRARSQFEPWAHTYDRSLLNHILFRPAYMTFIEELVRWLDADSRPNGRTLDLLDIGCGTGTLAAMIMAAGLPIRVVGLDFAESMAAVANRKAHETHAEDRARFVCADSEHLPFADASFDCITCSNSFHHYPDQQCCVRQMHRVLRPGGRLMLIDGFRDNAVGWFVFDVIVDTYEKGVHHATAAEFRTYFNNAGFAETRQRKCNLFLPLILTTATRP